MKNNNKISILKNIIIFLIIIIFSIILFKNITRTEVYSSNLSLVETNLHASDSSEEYIYIPEEDENINLITLSDEEVSQLANLTYDEKLQYLYDDGYSLETRLKIFLGSYIDTVGLIYYNFDTSEKISFNENEDFIAASTYKVGLNILYYYLESIGEINLSDMISYTWDDYEEGTGILQTYDYIGSIAISELLDFSLIYSDNIATNMLGRYLGGHAAVRKLLYNLLDITYSTVENTITPEIEYEILYYLYTHKTNSNFAHMIDVLTNTEFKDRMDKYLPSSLVAHKVGTYDTYIHDVGIILDDSPYILVVYTEGLENADEIIAQISKVIYNYNITL